VDSRSASVVWDSHQLAAAAFEIWIMFMRRRLPAFGKLLARKSCREIASVSRRGAVPPGMLRPGSFIGVRP
jgi:hypothetical protein